MPDHQRSNSATDSDPVDHQDIHTDSASSVDTVADLDPLTAQTDLQQAFRPRDSSVLGRILNRFGFGRHVSSLPPSYEMAIERRHAKRVRKVTSEPEGSPSSSQPVMSVYRDDDDDDPDDVSPVTATHTTPGRPGPDRANAAADIRWCRIGSMLALVVIPLSIILYRAYSAPRKSIQQSDARLKYFNGSSWFADTTLLISLDGFRADFLHRGLTPVLNSFVQQGVSPRWMLPSFPSLTFPNHWTLATGLHPESHGIVANSFWDPALKRKFGRGSSSDFLSPQWWLGEPIWETAEKAGLRTAIHMWPGSEVPRKVVPAYVDTFYAQEKLDRKVERILGFFDLPGRNDSLAIRNPPRPQLVAAYVPNVDTDGHLYGPNSTEIHRTIREVDTMLGSIFDGLESRNLTNIVNVIIVSDHGMATTSVDRLVQIDDLIDMSLIDTIDGWPHYGLRPKQPSDLESLYETLKSASDARPGFDVYLRDRDMPAQYHFSRHARIAPLWVIPHPGWAIVTRGLGAGHWDAAEAKRRGKIFHPRGIHGYDNRHPLMRSIFVARGPAFPHASGSRLAEFQNTEVYNIVCDSLGIEPVGNNGTMRLPLETLGKHEDVPPGDVIEDLGA